MIRSVLITAMDFAASKIRKYETYTYRRGNTWFIVRSGPKYSNTFRVTEFDEHGKAELESREKKEESR